jgi:3-oxoacyl-[acyl-carrier protein] reductase
VCVTNCGGPPAKNFLDIGLDEWRSAVDSILMSAIYFAREALPRMKAGRWGRLLMITSMSVKQPVEGLILSSSLRAAVTGLARTLANEFGTEGITVNTVCPGYTLTDRLSELADARAASAGAAREQVLDRWRSEVPVGRIGTPDEFAAAVAFLCSAPASYINGATLAVDGGWAQSLL